MAGQIFVRAVTVKGEFHQLHPRIAAFFQKAAHRRGHDAQILGENGSVLVRDFVRSTRAELYDEAGEPVATFTEDAGDGFLYEIDHFCQLLRQGALESPLVPLDDTLACAKVFDQLRIR